MWLGTPLRGPAVRRHATVCLAKHRVTLDCICFVREKAGIEGRLAPMAGAGMQLIKGFEGLASGQRGASVALGNFDGVHRGHQALIAEAARAGGQTGAATGVITFEPHPRRFFQPGTMKAPDGALECRLLAQSVSSARSV